MSYEVVYVRDGNFEKDETLCGKKFVSIPKLIGRMEVGQYAAVRILKGTWAGYYRNVKKTSKTTYTISRRPQMEY